MLEPMSVLIQRKQQLDQDIKNIERQIFELEETYLEDTHFYGTNNYYSRYYFLKGCFYDTYTDHRLVSVFVVH